MLETGNLGCAQGTSCNQTSEPVEDRSQFGMSVTSRPPPSPQGGSYPPRTALRMVLLVLYLSWLLEGPIKQRRAFLVDRDRWAIVSAPLVLSVDLTNNAMLDRIWPIVANREAVAVNQHWSGSPGQLLLTEQGSYPSPLSKKGFYAYPAVLGQSRGWQNVPGMTGPAPWQHGPCKDEWTGGPCVHHYMTLGGGPKNMTVDAADDWCNANSSCYGFL